MYEQEYKIMYRPYLVEFLLTLSEHYELILFTSSHLDYLNTIADEINRFVHVFQTGSADKEVKDLFPLRLCRSNCIDVAEGF